MTNNIVAMQRNLKLGRVTQLGFGSILLVMLGVGVVSQVSMRTLVESNHWVAHTYRVREEVRALEKELVDAETGQRGFMLTKQEVFLDPYHEALKELESTLDDLKELVSDNPAQVARIERLEVLSQQKLDYLARTIALTRAGQNQNLQEMLLSEEGKQMMDTIRSEIENIIQVETTLLKQRQQAASQAEALSRFVSIGGTAIVIVIGLISLLIINRKVIRPISQVTNNIASSSSEIAATIAQQERVATQQATSVTQTTSTMDELGSSARQSAEQAEQAAAAAQEVANLAIVGTTAVEHTLDDMATLNSKVAEIANHILRLSEQTGQIGNISNLVGDLDNQTNMLALNAAVEAVRAGEHGRGFSVVAAEIRKLADQSQQSTGRINELITDIQTAINATMQVTEAGTQTVQQSVTTAQGTADTFTKVADAINRVVISSQQISLTAKQQAIATEQVVSAMNALNQGAVQNASGISQTKASIQSLNEAALSLQAVI